MKQTEVEEERRFDVPEYYGEIDTKSARIVVLEYLQGISLEKILLKEDSLMEKSIMLKRTIDSLIPLHVDWSENPRKMRYARKKEDYTKEFIEDVEQILRCDSPLMLEEWQKKDKGLMKNAISKVSSYLDLEVNKIIHLDLHPGNVLVENDKYYLVDFDHVGIGPVQFDLVDLLKHPSFGASFPLVEKLVDYYIVERIDYYMREKLGSKIGTENIKEIDEDYRNQFIKTFYFSSLIRDVRNAGFASWAKLEREDMYNERVRILPAYEFYKEWYLDDYRKVLDMLLDEKSFLLDRREIDSLETVRRISSNYGISRVFRYSRDVFRGYGVNKKKQEENVCQDVHEKVYLMKCLCES